MNRRSIPISSHDRTTSGSLSAHFNDTYRRRLTAEVLVRNLVKGWPVLLVRDGSKKQNRRIR